MLKIEEYRKDGKKGGRKRCRKKGKMGKYIYEGKRGIKKIMKMEEINKEEERRKKRKKKGKETEGD